MDVEFLSPIQCRQRRSNRRCKRKINITPRADDVEWKCTECEASGIITGWRGSDCDLSGFAIASDAAGLLMLYLPEDEYRALHNVLMYTRVQEALIAGAVWTGDEVLLSGRYADFDELAGNLAFEVNHSRGKKQMVLNEVCDRIEVLLY